MKIPIFLQNSSKICIFKILIKKNKIKVQIFFYFYSTWLVLRLPIFKSIGPLVAEIWGGGGGGGRRQNSPPPPPPPPPMDSSPQNNPMGLGLTSLYIKEYHNIVIYPCAPV